MEPDVQWCSNKRFAQRSRNFSAEADCSTIRLSSINSGFPHRPQRVYRLTNLSSRRLKDGSVFSFAPARRDRSAAASSCIVILLFCYGENTEVNLSRAENSPRNAIFIQLPVAGETEARLHF